MKNPLKETEKFFDKYEFKARIIPAFLLLCPLFLTILFWFISTFNISLEEKSGIFLLTIILLISTVLFLAVLKFLGSTISSLGKEKEKQLYKKWGGKPTNMLLRFSDETINSHTKKRYHKFFKENIEGINFLPWGKEKADLVEADKNFESAIDFLRNQRRDKSKYPLVFEENINYGFSRNLFAMKPRGVLLNLFLLVTSSAWIFLKYLQKVNWNSKNSILESLQKIPPQLTWLWFIYILFLISWCFVRSDWVKSRGYAYARALLETCDEAKKSVSSAPENKAT